jgi:hypothetical protein
MVISIPVRLSEVSQLSFGMLISAQGCQAIVYIQNSASLAPDLSVIG